MLKPITLFLLLFTVIARAQLSPGDLHHSHAGLEGVENCTKCHVSGKKLSSQKCLTCHTLLKSEIQAGKGLHAGKDFKNCASCHVEHQGRNYDLIYWKNGRDKFDHAKTGYKLLGKHKSLKCEKCHTPENIQFPRRLTAKKKKLGHTFLGLQQNCLSCHQDEHRGQMDKKCLKCHDMKGWKPAPKFNHNKTKYPLTGLHKKVKCAQCHKKVTDNKFKGNADYLKFAGVKFNSCLNCHKDQHHGKFGKNCTTCHTTAGWKKYNKKKFNHDKTAFPLKGRHKNLACKKCHLPGKPLKIKAYKKCKNCHKDVHQGQFMRRKKKGACEECHSVNGFSPSSFSLEMHALTDYPLEGAHLAIPCIACHKKEHIQKRRAKTIRFHFASTQCESCHKDPHEGKLKKFMRKKSPLTGKTGCAYCHTVDSFNDVKFNHDATDFPLKGQHKEVACVSCHKDAKARKGRQWHFSKMKKNCASCHTDQHKGQLADRSGKTDCARCHTPIDWLADKFNHDRDARFKLKGAHENVACKLCHKPFVKDGTKIVRYKPLKSQCEACHGKK